MSIISRRSLLVGIAAAAVVPCAVAAGAPPVFEGPVPHAQCGSGSHPETALSGEVTVKEREDGKSQAGYWCNMVQVGNYAGEAPRIRWPPTATARITTRSSRAGSSR